MIISYTIFAISPKKISKENLNVGYIEIQLISTFSLSTALILLFIPLSIFNSKISIGWYLGLLIISMPLAIWNTLTKYYLSNSFKKYALNKYNKTFPKIKINYEGNNKESGKINNILNNRLLIIKKENSSLAIPWEKIEYLEIFESLPSHSKRLKRR
ncbi:MAG: hypothetical protein DRP06_00685 [Candidatus Aenigmatarchaeota archaeon]|nr:MAG: hypothetical protein DRP06_00685 [Candidatus Aenigmarchaeota archaeon]